MFPAAAALAWAVLAYLCIDFGFWHKLFAIAADGDRIWRAGAEAVLAATLLVFLFAYLNLNRWHVRYSHVVGGLAGRASPRWSASPSIEPPVAAGVARISHRDVAVVGFAAHRLSRDPRLRPRHDADPDLDPAAGLGRRGVA